MHQQINLYQPILNGKSTRVSAGTATWILVVVCAVLSLWQIRQGRQVTQLERQAQSARAQQQRQSELAAATGADRATRDDPLRLQRQAEQLVTRLGERQRALELLSSGAAGTTGGFADRLEALARRRLDGVWLDHIVLGAAGGVTSLTGHTVDPNLVPSYLQALAGEPALRGTRFDEFRIGEPPNPDTGSPDAVDSPSAGEAPRATHSGTPKIAPGAIRFRASHAAPPQPQSSS
jgi:hypothetical protein